MGFYLKTELSHYGVKGMKWGVRHDEPRTTFGRYKKSVKAAKASRKSRDAAITKRYDAFEKAIESPYKRGQNLSAKDVDRLNKVDAEARRDWKKSKETYKSDVKSARKAVVKDIKDTRAARLKNQNYTRYGKSTINEVKWVAGAIKQHNKTTISRLKNDKGLLKKVDAGLSWYVDHPQLTFGVTGTSRSTPGIRSTYEKDKKKRFTEFY